MTDPRIEAAVHARWQHTTQFKGGMSFAEYQEKDPYAAGELRKAFTAAIRAADAVPDVNLDVVATLRQIGKRYMPEVFCYRPDLINVDEDLRVVRQSDAQAKFAVCHARIVELEEALKNVICLAEIGEDTDPGAYLEDIKEKAEAALKRKAT